MSLVGNLEDLSLGDILQIISLSQKSGVLVLQSDQGSGRIVFESGLIHAACVKGWPDDLRGILIGGGFIDPAGFDAAAADAAELGETVEVAVARESGLGAERISALVREAVEAAILEMFVWQRGDFSFDVRSDAHPEDPQTLLPDGLNGQYLAMEGMRVRDERARDAAGGDLEIEDADAADLDLDVEDGNASDLDLDVWDGDASDLDLDVGDGDASDLDLSMDGESAGRLEEEADPGVVDNRAGGEGGTQRRARPISSSRRSWPEKPRIREPRSRTSPTCWRPPWHRCLPSLRRPVGSSRPSS